MSEFTTESEEGGFAVDGHKIIYWDPETQDPPDIDDDE